MSDKIDKLLEILEQINELFPDINKVVINDNDPDDPDYVILATEDYITKMVETMDLGDINDIADEYHNLNSTEKKIIQ